MRKVLVVALSLAMFCTACSTAWVSTLDSILAAAAPALINILQIVAVAKGQPVDSNLAAKINADATVIKTLAADFAKASSGSAPGVCQQLQAALTAYQADQQLVLQVAQVSDPNTQTKITLLAGLVAGTVDAITAVIPSCRNAAAARNMKTTPPYSVSGFADRYNSILVAPTGNAVVDAVTPKLKLHRHSKLVRSVTFGRLQ
ncbi:MAG TPA: hypothetical protein VKI40_01880 [Terriglobales bacterium]|jgi:hypothetical protein|nr:hypothetical protein [Terriglobales bacterium]